MSTTRIVLAAHVGVMAALVALAVIFPTELASFLTARPELYVPVKMAHVLSATLFFGNVVIGTLWEARSLVSRRLEPIRHTYETVGWLDAFFTAPLILVAVVSGLTLGSILGGVFSMGWLSLAFGLFAFSGVFWLAMDIPTQGRVRAILAALPGGTSEAPPELLRLLRFRLGFNLCTIGPLLVVLLLMVAKPNIPSLRASHPEPTVHVARALR